MCRRSRLRFFKLFIPLFLLFSSCLHATKSSEETFTEIYKKKIWGTNEKGEPSSGGGSTLKATEEYRKFLQEFFKTYHVRSLVDVGCGDWEFSKAIDWGSIYYIGYDVVNTIVNKNRELYSNSHTYFIEGDGLTMDLVPADVLICKDVLQHLSTEDIKHFLKQIHKFKYCLITNDIDPKTGTSLNLPVATGQYRPIDLTQPPFNIKGIKIFTYHAGSNTIKQVLLISPEEQEDLAEDQEASATDSI